MRKKILGLISLFLIVFSAYSQMYSYTVKGSFSPIDFSNKYVYLEYLNTSDWSLITIDSTLVVNNKFEFTKSVDSKGNILAFISTKNDKKIAPGFFIAEKGLIEISLGSDSVKVGGTPLNEEYQIVMDSLLAKTSRLVRLSQEDEADNEDARAYADIELQKLNEQISAYIEKHIKTSIGEYFILSLSEMIEPQTLLSLISKASPEFQDNNYVKAIRETTEAQELKTVGGFYKDLRLKNPEGKEVALSDYVGKSKYVLLDFWASWCRPCLNEMPILADAYKIYKSKGFEIIGISLDDSASAWKNIIRQKKITWPQMSDLKGSESEAGIVYGISTIPFTLLLDADGKIVATNLGGQDLLDKLEELFSK